MVRRLGPGLVAVATGWTFELIRLGLLDEEFRGSSATRWAATLAIALGVVWVSVAMRLRGERAERAVDDAEATFRDLAGLHELSTVLLAAVAPLDVARGLIERTPSLVGARGGSLGLIEGSDLVIVDPQVTGSTHRPGFRLPLETRAPIAQAARLGSIVRVSDRQAFERDYPDGAALSPYAHGAVAVPLWVAGEVVGALSLLFDDMRSAHEEAEAIVALVAGLGGQALERAGLYAQEREAREALDRILRITRVSTRTARERRRGNLQRGRRNLRLGRGNALAACGTQARARLRGTGCDAPRGDGREYRGLPEPPRRARPAPGVSVPDIQQEARGEGLERVRRLDLRSSLRVPVATGGGEAG